jgi:hypothetical protein
MGKAGRDCVRTASWVRAVFSRPAIAAKAFLLVNAFVANSFADINRTSVDAKGDGLIEIYDLHDLNQIRLSPEGSQVYGRTDGCPAAGCNGYQLVADLDFDTNLDSVVDENDDFYTTGSGALGWAAIPLLTSTFDGGGHTIKNLTRIGHEGGSDPEFFDQPGGLFAVLDGADVFDLRFEGVSLTEVGPRTGTLAGVARGSSLVAQLSVVDGISETPGFSMVGGIIGSCENSQLQESFTSFDVRPSGMGGGLIGYADNCVISRSFVLGRTTSSRYHAFIGGLVGYMIGGAIEDSFLSGSAGEGYLFGGLIGETEGSPLVRNSYVSGAVIGNSAGGGAMIGVGQGTFVSSFYATDTTGFDKTRTGGDEAEGVTLADLQCPTSAGDSACRPGLFAGWGASVNSDGAPAWDFGTAQQVPALRIAGVVYRDSDGDGILDAQDDFPFNWEASLDSDGDGAVDFWREGCNEQCRAGTSLVLDQFPDNDDATRDLDLDGLPDAWNPSCNSACRASSALSLDPSAGDYDNDGLPDLTDQDDDGDGDPDIDLDSDNLIDIDSLEDLVFVNFDPTGASRRTEDFGGLGIALGDTSGCRPRIVRGVLARECDGYELLTDLNLDTNDDGEIDEQDDYWNDGAGWVPIGHLGDDVRQAFQTNFEGNGHTVSNVFVNRGMESAFFGGTRGANIRNLGVIGDATLLMGQNAWTGSLVGYAEASVISNCYSTGWVFSEGSAHAGGLVGRFEGGRIIGSFSTGQVTASAPGATCNAGGLAGTLLLDATVIASFASGFTSDVCTGTDAQDPTSVGGLVGFLEAGSVVSGSFSIGPVSGSSAFQGGLIGRAEGEVVDSYWATDTSTQGTSAGAAEGALVTELECPTGPDDTACLPGVTLYAGWGQYEQSGYPAWDFGTTSELPGLCLAGTLHRVDRYGMLQAPSECACTSEAAELSSNPRFETSTSGWSGLGATLSSSTLQAHGGLRSLRIANRTQPWNGADYNLLGAAVPGETLTASLWARIENDPNEPVLFTLRSTCQGGSTAYTRIAERTVTNTGWVRLTGTIDVPDCQLSQLVAYAEGPRAGVNFFIDDVSITRSTISCAGVGAELDGHYVVYSSWTQGYCVEVVVTNTQSVPTSDWSATVDLNGTTIDPNNIWNLDTTGFSGTVELSPTVTWAQVLNPGQSSHSLGFCGIRPPGNASLPDAPEVLASF